MDMCFLKKTSNTSPVASLVVTDSGPSFAFWLLLYFLAAAFAGVDDKYAVVHQLQESRTRTEARKYQMYESNPCCQDCLIPVEINTKFHALYPNFKRDANKTA